MKKVMPVRDNSTSLSPRESNSNFLEVGLPKSIMKNNRSTSKKQVKICPKSFKEIPSVQIPKICLSRDFKVQGFVKSYKDIPSKVQSFGRSCSKKKLGSPDCKKLGMYSKANSKTSLTKLDSKKSLTKKDSTKKSSTKISSKNSLPKLGSNTSLDML